MQWLEIAGLGYVMGLASGSPERISLPKLYLTAERYLYIGSVPRTGRSLSFRGLRRLR
jgi:hypothetical protein